MISTGVSRRAIRHQQSVGKSPLIEYEEVIMSFFSRVLLADAATCLVFGLLLLVDGGDRGERGLGVG